MKLFWPPMQLGRSSLKIFWLAAGGALLAGCASPDANHDPAALYRHYGEIKGTLKQGRYTAPDGSFSCAIPELAEPGATIKDTANTTADGRSGTVGFQDEMGALLRVDWLELSPSERLQGTNLVFDRAVEETFSQLMFSHYQQVSPAASLADHEFISDPGEEKLFAVALLPGGSTLSDKSSGQRLDAYRAALIFRRGNWVYCLSTQFTKLPGQAAPPLAATLAQLKKTLQVFRGSFQFP